MIDDFLCDSLQASGGRTNCEQFLCPFCVGLDCMLIVWHSDAPASRARKRSKRDLVDRVINPLPLVQFCVSFSFSVLICLCLLLHPIPCLGQITGVSIATGARRVLFQYASRVELWSLASTNSAPEESEPGVGSNERQQSATTISAASLMMERDGEGDNDGSSAGAGGGEAGAVCAALPLANGPKRLVTIEAPEGSVFVASALSPCGRLLAIAHSRAALRLFQVYEQYLHLPHTVLYIKCTPSAVRHLVLYAQ